MDLKSLNLKELKALQDDVAIAIFECEKREMELAREEIARIAQSRGFSLNDLIDTDKSIKPKKKATPKYVNPENTSQTWSGRGRRPKWVETALANGHSLTELSIKES